MAGLLLSQSDFGHRALSEVVPLRHAFSALFFVSLGMLTEPAFFAEHWDVIIVVIGVAVPVKFILTAFLTRAFGYLPHTAPSRAWACSRWESSVSSWRVRPLPWA